MSLIPTFIVKPDGSIEYHPLIEYLRSITFNPDPPNDVINLLAGGRSQLLPFTARDDGHIVLTKMMVHRTGEATIRIYDPARKCQWMNNEVHIDTIVGNGGLPSLLVETVFLEATRAILIEFRDLSGAPNAIRFAFGGAKLYHKSAPQDDVRKFLGQKRLLTYPFFMTPDGGAFTLAAGGVSQQFASISSDFDFEIYKINSISDENFTYDIRHRGDTLSNNAQVHNLVATGTGEFPYVLPQPFVVKRNERLTLNFTNLSAVNPNTVYFTMIGRAIVLNR